MQFGLDGAEEDVVRIGTWNVDDRWSPAHERFLQNADCDVWLLTEVNPRVELGGYRRHLSVGAMARGQRWAGVYSRLGLEPLPDPHVASAAAIVDGITYCSSILPWRTCGGEPNWPGIDLAEKTGIALERLLERLPRERLVWGGDWNHSLAGKETAGSLRGRDAIQVALQKLNLKAPTERLLHQIDGLLSIDHIAVPDMWPVRSAEQLKARGLSDHDCYVVVVER